MPRKSDDSDRIGGRSRCGYRVTIRYLRAGVQQYRILEFSAHDLNDAMAQANERFPEDLRSLADLVEVRLSNPAS